MIENVINIISSNTMLLVLTIIIFIMIIVAVLKRFVRLFFIAVLLLAVYVGYLFYTGQEIPSNSEEIIKHGAEKLEEIKLNSVKKQMKAKGLEVLEGLTD